MNENSLLTNIVYLFLIEHYGLEADNETFLIADSAVQVMENYLVKSNKWVREWRFEER